MTLIINLKENQFINLLNFLQNFWYILFSIIVIVNPHHSPYPFILIAIFWLLQFVNYLGHNPSLYHLKNAINFIFILNVVFQQILLILD